MQVEATKNVDLKEPLVFHAFPDIAALLGIFVAENCILPLKESGLANGQNKQRADVATPSSIIKWC